jgi:hypothetical protein
MSPGNWVQGSYENVAVTCEHCKRPNIFNRASDLKKFTLIGGEPLTCLFQDCAKQFHALGDSINAAYQMLVFDSEELYRIKRYSLVILSLAQAWEVFFANFLRIKLAYKPFAVHDDLDKMNADILRLFEETKELTFEKLRSIFLRMMIDPAGATTVDEFLRDLVRLSAKPPLDDLNRVPEELQVHCLRLYKSDLGSFRNQVVHKNAYRPKKEEVDFYLHETRETLFPLGRKLDIEGDDVNWYLREVG